MAHEQPAPGPPGLDREQPTDRTEIVVGLLTLNNAATIESLVKSVVEGLRESFPNVSASSCELRCWVARRYAQASSIEIAAGLVPVRLIPNAASTYANLTRESGFPGRDESIRNSLSRR